MTLAVALWACHRPPGPAHPDETATPPDGAAGHSADPDDPHHTGAATEETATGADGDDPSFLFEDVVVTELAIELAPAAFDALLAEPRVYVPGVVRYGDEVYDPVGVRLKGNGSFQPIDQKPSFKISFDEYDPDLEFHGLEKLVLNNMANDPSSMHERLAHRVYREAGVPDVRSGHGFVTLNGEPYGLYVVDENVDEDLLKRFWADPDGPMWEIFDADFTSEGVLSFEHEEGVDDRATLVAVGALLDTIEPTDWAALAPYVDDDAFLRYWAVSAVIGQFDAWPYSFPGDDVHIYQDPADGRLDFVPHGCDETFADPLRPVDFVYGSIADACLADPACADRFAAEVWSVQALTESIDLLAYADEIQLALAPWLGDDRRAAHTPEDRQAAHDAFLAFVTGRPTALADVLGPRPPAP